MIKLEKLETYTWGKELTFKTDTEEDITIQVGEGKIYVNVSDMVSLNDLEEAIAIVRSGKLEIELWPTL